MVFAALPPPSFFGGKPAASAKLGSAKLTDFGLAKQYRGGRDAIAEAAGYHEAYAYPLVMSK